METGEDGKIRCFGASPVYAAYHDEEWGVPVHDDRHLFEMLILEGAQAGLNWETVLMKRDGYRRVFHDFDVAAVAAMSDDDLEEARHDAGIVRNKLKIAATRRNAAAFLEIQQEFGSFNAYLWRFVDGAPVINHWPSMKAVPTTTKESDALSSDLKARGMSFVGSTIIYAYMQAVGMVNDHVKGCWKYPEARN
ncbi:DNA-3-methyladenine glycosylase I [Algicella marina]|uniref:DNA-3-methyladenine glycosylase I n=1 Tax=Algicella marina TaxID=2683284 RepID=A0A6P1T0S4_9RHOB|nr:DNA-3-methyladenine glycosylase I [Algicella marina]QHQ34122.1 DNA-3-methyladenine glycosylase I [Algicella marina]